MTNSPYYKVIEEKGFYICTPIGKSMEPMLIEREDTVKLVKVTSKLKKGDIILYLRPSGKHVLHRIVKVKKQNYWLCGDNQVGIEKNVDPSWIIGVVEGFYKKETYIEINNKDYIKYYKKRMRSRKWRHLKHIIKKIFGK